MTVLGINELLIGIRMKFNIETCEEHGVFFSVNHEYWQRIPKETGVVKKKKKY